MRAAWEGAGSGASWAAESAWMRGWQQWARTFAVFYVAIHHMSFCCRDCGVVEFGVRVQVLDSNRVEKMKEILEGQGGADV